MRNDNQQRAEQPPIHTHLPDQVPKQDEQKLVSDEASPHVRDYNDPPPEGAGKSMGAGLDDVGGRMGEPAGSETRSEGLLPAEGQQQDDGRFNVAEEVSLDQQSDQARQVGSLEDTAAGPHGDKLEDAVARSLGKKD